MTDKKAAPAKPDRPYFFRVRGYRMVVRAENWREAIRQARRRYGLQAVPEMP